MSTRKEGGKHSQVNRRRESEDFGIFNMNISPTSSQVGGEGISQFSVSEVEDAGLALVTGMSVGTKEDLADNAAEHHASAESENAADVSGLDANEASDAVCSETDGGEASEKSTEDSNTALKKTRKGSRKDVLKFIEKPKVRTQTAKVRGETLKKHARDLHTLTAARVFVKAEYKGQHGGIYQFVYGDDFMLTPAEKEADSSTNDASPVASSTEILSRDTLKEIVSEAVTEGLDRSFTEHGSSASTAHDERFNSPTTATRRPAPLRRRIASSHMCQVCHREDSYVLGSRGIQIKVDWFLCSSADCTARAHNECLGLPNVQQHLINAIAPWYCSLHVGCGRPAITDETTPGNVGQGDSAELPADEVTSRGRARGTRGRPRSGRGSRGPRGARGKATE